MTIFNLGDRIELRGSNRRGAIVEISTKFFEGTTEIDTQFVLELDDKESETTFLRLRVNALAPDFINLTRSN